MKTYAILLIVWLLSTTTLYAQSPSRPMNSPKLKFLIHVTQSQDATRAALAFLVAKTALEEGHTVSLFLAGDGVRLLQDQTLNELSGLGTGKLREHYDAIVKGNGRFYLSGNSSKARGMTEADLKDKPAEFALPTVLVKLAAESDRILTY
ncbi:DsrE family protein [Larkinella rosea]|uniref:Multidrug transporter n=1 Tax=Larkinella rosea TaxID=2025312 RepID=A0A3P1BZN1_9BACT|nr:DsrE family protein [Larkinella rosea]RRB06326.1 multidrug transporter [Larkinella rosea]